MSKFLRFKVWMIGATLITMEARAFVLAKEESPQAVLGSETLRGIRDSEIARTQSDCVPTVVSARRPPPISGYYDTGSFVLADVGVELEHIESDMVDEAVGVKSKLEEIASALIDLSIPMEDCCTLIGEA